MIDEPISLEASIENRREELAEIGRALICDHGAIAQASDDVRNALELIAEHIHERRYQAAGDAGYNELSSGYIFLQRVLGSVVENANRRNAVISDIAKETHLAFEEVEPSVRAWMESHSTHA